MRSTLFTIFLFVAVPAFAQNTTISASIAGDIARFTSTDTGALPVGDLATLDGEAIGFTVGVGRAIGERWGVAMEFGRTGEIERRHEMDIDPRISARPSLVPPGIPIPDFSFVTTTELQVMTISALAWVKHDAGQRIEMTYSGGMTFARSESERDFEITDPRLLAIWALPTGLKTVEYDQAPVAGIDAAIKFTDHTALIAGVRLHGIRVQAQSGWLVRPAIGVRWAF
jgi:hypothetical protein